MNNTITERCDWAVKRRVFHVHISIFRLSNCFQIDVRHCCTAEEHRLEKQMTSLLHSDSWVWVGAQWESTGLAVQSCRVSLSTRKTKQQKLIVPLTGVWPWGQD